MNKRLLLYSFAAWIISILIFLIISVPYMYDKQLEPLKGFPLMITLVDITVGILAFLIWTGIGTYRILRWIRRHVPAWILVTSAVVLVVSVVLVIAGIVFLIIRIPNEQSPATKPPQPQQQASLCTRTTPYVMEPRFVRALNFIQERTNFSQPGRTSKTPLLSVFLNPIINCLNIQYCSANSMGGAEGSFLFSPETSSQDKLSICISDRYISQDDLLTSIILSHEIVHAIQFALAMVNAGGNNNPASFCYEDEAYAFTEQFMFMVSTTRGELSSLFSRMASIAYLDLQVATAKHLFETGVSLKQIQRDKGCDRTFPQDNNKNFECLYNSRRATFEEEIRKNPYYQKQCGTR